jgi:predicted butyrate kinase (DUF1464 family)
MVVNIGVDCGNQQWKTCLLEDGRTLELRSFLEESAAIAYLQQTCAIYPEPTIVLASSSSETPLPYSAQRPAQALLIAIDPLHCYHLPAIRALPCIPEFRKKYRSDMGAAGVLATVTTLLYRMRKQEAIWQEMRFLYLEVGYHARNIVVVEDGRIVDGICRIDSDADTLYTTERPGADAHNGWSDHVEDTAIAEQAFWEELTQDLAGLMSIHHLEDIVVIGQRKEAVIERLSDRYQFYLYPQDHNESEGFEVAIGAAIIAEGMSYPGLAADVVERLQLSRSPGRISEQINQQLLTASLTEAVSCQYIES